MDATQMSCDFGSLERLELEAATLRDVAASIDRAVRQLRLATQLKTINAPCSVCKGTGRAPRAESEKG